MTYNIFISRKSCLLISIYLPSECIAYIFAQKVIHRFPLMDGSLKFDVIVVSRHVLHKHLPTLYANLTIGVPYEIPVFFDSFLREDFIANSTKKTKRSCNV